MTNYFQTMLSSEIRSQCWQLLDAKEIKHRQSIFDTVVGMLIRLCKAYPAKQQLKTFPEVYETAMRYIDAHVQKRPDREYALIAKHKELYALAAVILASKLLWMPEDTAWPADYFRLMTRDHLPNQDHNNGNKMYRTAHLLEAERQLHSTCLMGPTTIIQFLQFHLQTASNVLRCQAYKLADYSIYAGISLEFPPSTVATACIRASQLRAIVEHPRDIDGRVQSLADLKIPALSWIGIKWLSCKCSNKSNKAESR